MAIDENPASAYIPRSAYGRYIRERGTLRILAAAIALAIGWYVYGAIHWRLMDQVKWPALQPDPSGLTVLGLLDRPRPGWKPKYKAFEGGHAWKIRRTTEDEGGSEEPDQDRSERGSDPGAYHHAERGEVVRIEEVMKNCPTFLTGAHFAGAWIEEKPKDLLDRYHWVLHLDLTDEGRHRYAQFSRIHDDERTVFVLSRQVVTCPRIRSMDVTTLDIEPIWDKADAEKLASFVNKR